MDSFVTAAQYELGDRFGFSPASCEWIAETLMEGPVSQVPTESAVTDRLIREIAFQESKAASDAAFDSARRLGFDYGEAAEQAAGAREARYRVTAREADAVAKELGLR